MENEIIKAGTKIVFRAECGVGTDTCEFFILTYDISAVHLSDNAWDFGVQHAESYGVYLPSEDLSEEEDSIECSADIEGWYEIYNAEEHDGLRVGGGNHFQEM